MRLFLGARIQLLALSELNQSILLLASVAL